MSEHQRKKLIRILSSLFLIIIIAMTGCNNGGGSSGGGITIIDNRIPSITGVWTGPITYDTRTATISYNLTQSISDITGTCSCSNEHGGTGTVTGTISGKNISFTQTSKGCSDISVTGTVNGYTSGNTMDLTATRPLGGDGCPALNLSFTLTKQ